MKVAVVGGGSTYTPELVDGFARLHGSLPVAELVLIDPAADRLNVIGPLGHGFASETSTACCLTAVSTSLLVGRSADARIALRAPSFTAWLIVA